MTTGEPWGFFSVQTAFLRTLYVLFSAMAAGVDDHIWSLQEIASLLD